QGYLRGQTGLQLAQRLVDAARGDRRCRQSLGGAQDDEILEREAQLAATTSPRPHVTGADQRPDARARDSDQPYEVLRTKGMHVTPWRFCSTSRGKASHIWAPARTL